MKRSPALKGLSEPAPPPEAVETPLPVEGVGVDIRPFMGGAAMARKGS
jgi:hypothetical protein